MGLLVHIKQNVSYRTVPYHTVGKKIPTSINQVFYCNIPNKPHDPSLVHTLDHIHNEHPSLESQDYKFFFFLYFLASGGGSPSTLRFYSITQ